VRKLMAYSGAIEEGKRVAKEFCDKGLSVLASFPESKAKRLVEFATTMTQRNKYYSVLDELNG
jgi:geranylgeranyl pyrophosphate synthase